MQTSSVAVLFVHGIQGQPRQFQFLIDALPPELELRAPMLPGHGVSAKAFHASGRKQWLAAVRRETQALRSEGKRVIFVGHSMGCLLGLKLSEELGAPYAQADPRTQAVQSANNVPVHGMADVLRLAHPYAELLRLIREIRRMEPRGSVPVRFRFSAEDRVVNAKSVPYAGRWPGADIRVLADCSHIWFTEQARRELQNDLFELLAEGKA